MPDAINFVRVKQKRICMSANQVPRVAGEYGDSCYLVGRHLPHSGLKPNRPLLITLAAESFQVSNTLTKIQVTIGDKSCP